MEHLWTLYPDKEEIIVLYQFPRPQLTGFDQNPLQ